MNYVVFAQQAWRKFKCDVYRSYCLQEAFFWASFIKNPAFVEEQEWRIVGKSEKVIEGTYVPQDVQYRHGKTSLIPYIKLEFPKNPGIKDFIDHVYIGPTLQMELSKRALQGFLGDSIELIESKVPYLG